MGAGAINGADATFVVTLEGGNVKVFRGQPLLDVQYRGLRRNGGRFAGTPNDGATKKGAAQQETH